MCKVITFFGGDSQVGTSMIAQSVGETLARNNYKTLLLLASCQYGNDYIKENIELSFDDIRFDNETLSLQYNIERAIYDYNKLDIIQCSNNMIAIRYYGEVELKKVLDSVESKYEYILIDGGHNIQFGLTMASLKLSSMKYFVINQYEKCLRRFINTLDTILNPLDYKGKIIVNKYTNSATLYNQNELLKMIGCDIEYLIPYIEYGYSAEQDKSTLLNNAKFSESISNIVSDILESSMKNTNNISKKRKGIFKWK